MPHFSLRSKIPRPEIHNICILIAFLSSLYLCHRTLYHQRVHPRSLWCSSHSRSPTHHPGIWPYGTSLVSQMWDGSPADGLLGPPHSVFSPFKASCPGVAAGDPSSGRDQCPSLFSEYLSLRSLCLGRASLIAQLVKNLPAMQETLVSSCVGKIHWRREWLPTPVFWPGAYKTPWTYTVHGVAKSRID